MRAIAVDVAARAFATRDDREGSLVATSMESEEEVGVVQETMVSGLEKQSLVDLDAYPDCVPPAPPSPTSSRPTPL